MSDANWGAPNAAAAEMMALTVGSTSPGCVGIHAADRVIALGHKGAWIEEEPRLEEWRQVDVDHVAPEPFEVRERGFVGVPACRIQRLEHAASARRAMTG